MAEIAGVDGEQVILDCCAAPGGKTLILAERNSEARIVACRVESAAACAVARALGAAWESESSAGLAMRPMIDEVAAYDLVLADVPCSGTGTLGRNPEIRHRLRPEDLARQAERQRAILRCGIAGCSAAVGAWFTPPVRWSRRRTRKWSRRCFRGAEMRACSCCRIGLRRCAERVFLTAGGARRSAWLRHAGRLSATAARRVSERDGFFVAMLEKAAR